MPRNKKRSSAKKKSKGGTSGSHHAQSPSSKDGSALTTGSLGYKDRPSPTKVLPADYSTIYSRYKNATNRFCRYMMDECPVHVRGPHETVDALMTVADWMDESQHPMDTSVLSDLKLAICTRKKVADTIYGGGDGGHYHFLQVLLYCWKVLVRPLPTTSRDRTTPEQSHATMETTSPSNQFDVLRDEWDNEENDNDDDDEESLGSAAEIRRPSPEAKPHALADMLASNARQDAVVFLSNLNSSMRYVSNKFTLVNRKYRWNKRKGLPKSALVGPLIDAAVATSLAIEQVKHMEMELVVEHPHLDTPYRVFAAIVFQADVENLKTLLTAHATKTCDEPTIVAFIGDGIEKAFRDPSDPSIKQGALVHNFCHKWEVDAEGKYALETVLSEIEMAVLEEVPFLYEMEDDGWNAPSHRWIPHKWTYIGRDRAIHHTIRLLQVYGRHAYGVFQEKSRSSGFLMPGSFGPSPCYTFHAKRVRDLDELLMNGMLPDWTLLGHLNLSPFAKGEMYLDEIYPMVGVMQRYAQNPLNCVTWSLAFAVHAMLVSVLETADINSEIASICKKSSALYCDRLDSARAEFEDTESLSQTDEFKMASLEALDPRKTIPLQGLEFRSCWNSLCGGSYLAYLTYSGNITHGLGLLDQRLQLRMTLHIYNALVTSGFIQRGKIPLLDTLFDVFRSSKALWPSGVAEQGEFVRKYYMCMEVSAADIKLMEKSARASILHKADPFLYHSIGNGPKRRKLTFVDPSQLATSYRRICNRNFSDVVDRYHTKEQRERRAHTDSYQLAVRINDTVDAVKGDQKLLALHLPYVGALLEKFHCELSKAMPWERALASDISLEIATSLKDARCNHIPLCGQILLGALDFAPDAENYEFHGVRVCQVAAAFFVEFFGHLDLEKVTWFQTVKRDV